MKYSTIAAAALLPLAWAADDFDTRKGGHLKWKITNLTAAIGDAYGTPYCMSVALPHCPQIRPRAPTP